MDIDHIDGDDGSITYTVKLTPEDVAAYPNAIAVLNSATTCAEILLGLSIVALEMQNKQGEFQMALREATKAKTRETGKGLLTTIYEKLERGDYAGLGAMTKELGVSVGEHYVREMTARKSNDLVTTAAGTHTAECDVTKYMAGPKRAGAVIRCTCGRGFDTHVKLSQADIERMADNRPHLGKERRTATTDRRLLSEHESQCGPNGELRRVDWRRADDGDSFNAVG